MTIQGIDDFRVRELPMHIGGEWVRPEGRPWADRASPGHAVAVTRTLAGEAEDVDRAVAAARSAFDSGPWPRMTAEERARVLLRSAALIRERAEEIALLETLESGKPIAQARGEVAGAAGIYEYAAGVARVLHGDSFNTFGDKMFGTVIREPVGVVGIITPWNFPFFILSERVPFVLASGCTIVAKPSELTSATTLLMAEILKEAGLPDGAFNVVTGLGRVVGQALTEHEDVDMVSFTGSTAVGRATLEASLKNFKRVSLELGGKNPHLVFADANLDEAADGVVFAACFNAGQCCVSGSRLVVDAAVAEEFEERLREKFARVRVGDPLDPETQVGATASEVQHDKILGYIERGRAEGARLVCGGAALERGAGLFMQPTLFGDVRRDMAIARDEIFGPVLGIQTFRDFDEAVAIANDSVYGLAASIWTKDLDKAVTAMRRVRAGRVWVNTSITGGPEMPIGGFKQSGHGRETGIYGVEEYTEIKSVHIALGPRELWVR